MSSADTNKNTAGIALVTGATSGIGRAIACRLLDEAFTVYGIGRDASKAPVHPGFHFLPADLADTASVVKAVASITGPVSLLVNAAGVAYYGPHETLSPAQIAEMVAVNVTAPMTLSNLLLRQLKEVQGTVINISSVTAKRGNNTHGCAYGATKAALSSFSESLFEECRKSGLRVITIHPDLTDTALYRNADFTPDPAPDCMVVTDITLRPQRNLIRRKQN